MKRKPKELVQFGLSIRRFRDQAGLSQEKLAQRCQLHRTYVGAVERGERNPGLMNIIRIARALGVRPRRLLEEIL